MELKYSSEFRSLAYREYHFFLQMKLGNYFARYCPPFIFRLKLDTKEHLSYFQFATDLAINISSHISNKKHLYQFIFQQLHMKGQQLVTEYQCIDVTKFSITF